MNSVKVSVEKLLEQEVEEISNTGEERYIKPRSYSDELRYLSGKIDFYEGSTTGDISNKNKSSDDDNPTAESNVKEESQGKNKNKEDEKQWPWDTVHSKLRLALSEVSVMLDVLQCLNRKKYLVLDQIQQNPEPNRQTVQMLEKRKYLARAGDIISKGANRLIKNKITDQEDIALIEMKDKYYMDLIHLRQYWSVKKVGAQITGTLSYQSKGSTFWHPGLFEIQPDLNEVENNKRLSVTISPDLTKTSFIFIEVIDSNSELILTSCSSGTKISNESWNLKLKDAQSNLFNKELFSQLCNDAFKSNILGNITVMSNNIRCKILNGVSVVIELRYCDTAGKTFDSKSADLELILENLLLKKFIQNSEWNKPDVTTSFSHTKSFASSSLHNILYHGHRSEISILQEFLNHVSVLVMVEKVKNYFEKKCREVNDPIIYVHWDCVIMGTKPSVQVSLKTNYGFKKRSKSFKLFIAADIFLIIFDDSTTFQFKSSITNLDVILTWCISNHFLDVSAMIAQQNNWHVHERSSTKLLSIGTDIPYFISFCNRKTNQRLLLKICDLKNIEVKVSQDFLANSDLDFNFQHMCQKFKALSWESIKGGFFIDKCQSLFV